MDKTFKSESDFLEAYNPNKYERPSISVDVLIFSVSSEEVDDYRRTDKKKMSVLLVKRDNYPFKGKWCLPGGFVKIDENLDDAPKRILKEEANIDNVYLEQLYTFGDVHRDPRMRVIMTSYIALIDKNRIYDKIGSNASWFDVIIHEESEDVVDVVLSNGAENVSFKIKKILREQTTDRYSFKEVENSGLAFDNSVTILSGLERLKNKLEYTDIVFNMMPEVFTLGELQQVYEVILGKKLLDPAFRRIIADKVEKTSEMRTGGGHRPSALFKYKK